MPCVGCSNWSVADREEAEDVMTLTKERIATLRGAAIASREEADKGGNYEWATAAEFERVKVTPKAAEYLALCDPQTVLAVLDRLADLEG